MSIKWNPIFFNLTKGSVFLALVLCLGLPTNPATAAPDFEYTQLTDTMGGSVFLGGINATGQHVLVGSTCDLVTGACPGPGFFQAFLYDTAVGTFERIAPIIPPTAHTAGLAISADGNRALIVSQMDLDASGDFGSWELFLWDRTSGISRITSSTKDVTLFASSASISADGTKVAFTGNGNYDVTLPSKNLEGIQELFYWSVATPIDQLQQVTDAVAPGLFDINSGQISGDGQWVAFATGSDDIPGWPSSEGFEIVVMDLTTVPPSVANATVTGLCNQPVGPPSGCESELPSVNGDGSRVAFHSQAGFPGTPGNGDANFEIFLLERQPGPTWTYTQLTNTSGRGITNAWIDGAGQKVVFQSNQDQLTTPTENADNNIEIFLWEEGAIPPIRQVTDTPVGVDIFTNELPQISSDGETIVFRSKADLDPLVGNADGNTEIFIAIAPNQAPVLDSIGPQNTVEGQTLIVLVSGSDPDGDSLTLTAEMLNSDPVSSIGATFIDNGDGTGELEWTPDFTQGGANYDVVFTVSDADLSDSETSTITVDDNQPPVLDSIGPKTVDAGQLLTFEVTANDPDNHELTLSATNLPAGASFPPQMGTGAVNGTFTWTAPLCPVDPTPSVTFEVTDGDASDSEVVAITVQNTNCPPEITISGTDCIGDVCMMYESSPSAFDELTFEVTATDPDGEDVVDLGFGFITAGKILIQPSSSSTPRATFELNAQTIPSELSGTYTWNEISSGTPVSFSALGSCSTSRAVTFVAEGANLLVGSSSAVTIELVPCGPGNPTCSTLQPHAPVIQNVTSRGQVPDLYAAFAWIRNIVGLGRPFELTATACDPDNPSENLSYAWTYQGSNPAGVNLTLTNPDQPMATGTSPGLVSQDTLLNFAVEVTDTTPLTSAQENVSIRVDPDCVTILGKLTVSCN